MDPQIPEPQSTSPAPSGVEHCYRHPSEETRVHCTRCGRPICPQCMIAAPVGHQCPECVGAARQEFRRGPGRRIATTGAPVTRVLLLAIAAMFVVEVVVAGAGSLLGGPDLNKIVDLGAMYPPAIAFGDQYWRLFTSMFLHFGLWHIGFNAYALWLFGQVVERDYGHARFALIFLLGGLAASATSYAFGPVGAVAAGASGAVFAVFGAFAAYNFRRRHLASAAANLRSALGLIAINLLLAFVIQGIDWRAHLGGLVAGFVLGTAADDAWRKNLRPLMAAAGFVGIIALTVALVVWANADIRAEFAPFVP